MKHITVLFALVLAFPCVAQQAFDWPFQNGDRVVVGGVLYCFVAPEVAPTSVTDTCFTHLHRMNLTELQIPFSNSSYGGYMENPYSTNAGITKSGMFAIEGYRGYTELFPARPFASDTIWLHEFEYPQTKVNTGYCVNQRTFDTTVFGETVQAFAFDVYDEWKQLRRSITIADKFWILQIKYLNGAVHTLEKFRIGNKTHNIGPYTFRFPKFCKDMHYSYRDYRVYMSGGDHPGAYSRNDTAYSKRVIVKNVPYYITKIRLFPGLALSWDTVRSVDGGIAVLRNGFEQVIPQPSVFLGDSVGDMWFTKLEVLDYHGERSSYYFMHGWDMMESDFRYARYYSGIGVFEDRSSNDMFFMEQAYLLEKYTPCGTGVGIEPLPISPSIESTAYPSPACETVTISFGGSGQHLPISGVLWITDETGRIFLEQRNEDVAKHPIAVDVTGYPSGMYFYSLSDRMSRASGSFVVRR